MPKYLISRVRAVAFTYIVEAGTENKALEEFQRAVDDSVETSYDLHNTEVIEDYIQSEGELND